MFHQPFIAVGYCLAVKYGHGGNGESCAGDVWEREGVFLFGFYCIDVSFFAFCRFPEGIGIPFLVMYGAVLLKAIGEPVIGAFYRIYQVKAATIFIVAIYR